MARSYDIEFGQHAKVGISIINGELKIIGAINSHGDTIKLSEIKIKEMPTCPSCNNLKLDNGNPTHKYWCPECGELFN